MLTRSSERGGSVQIFITGTIAIEPGKRDALLAAIRPLVRATREEELGCLEYAFTADTVEDDRIVVLERWLDEATLAAHFEHPNFHATKGTLHEYGSGQSVINKYRVDLGEPLRDSARRYRADFFTSVDGAASD
jgi:quinol monooxygenase YgiN